MVKKYSEVTDAIADNHQPEVKEMIVILYKSSISIFLFSFAILSIFTLRNFLAGIGNAVIVAILTSTGSLLLLLVLIDFLIGLTKRKVVNGEFEPEIGYSNLRRDSLKSLFALAIGMFVVLGASSFPTVGITGTDLANLTILQPVYEQMFLAGLTLIGVAYLLTGAYTAIGPILYFKKNYDAVRRRLRDDQTYP